MKLFSKKGFQYSYVMMLAAVTFAVIVILLIVRKMLSSGRIS
jgi:hypothetical protein